MSVETAENEPITSVHGLGWRLFSPDPDTYGLHHESVDPGSADPGEVLYVRRDEFPNFVALVDFVGESVGIDGIVSGVRRAACPIEFRVIGTEGEPYRAFAVPPARGDRVKTPVSKEPMTVDSVVWDYSGMGMRTAVVWLR